MCVWIRICSFQFLCTNSLAQVQSKKIHTCLISIENTSCRVLIGFTKYRNIVKEELCVSWSICIVANNSVGNKQDQRLNLEIPTHFVAVGAKLCAMTQALLYQGVLEQQKTHQRRGTTICLDMARHAVNGLGGYLPSDGKLWRSLKNKDISRNIWAWLWKCMHNALQCGAYWMNIPGYEQRAVCPVCRCDESMEHILMECRASGQETVWKLARELLMKKGISQTSNPTFGQILGCGLACIHDQRGRVLKGSSRLHTIVLSESAYLIWRLRCEWRIERAEDQQNLHTEAEISNRWLVLINMRLKLDCLMANRWKFGRKAIDPVVVMKTWNGVLHDERGLPDNWVLETGVLVGMRVECPLGRNR